VAPKFKAGFLWFSIQSLLAHKGDGDGREDVRVDLVAQLSRQAEEEGRGIYLSAAVSC
jgi:hypothetical protein